MRATVRPICAVSSGLRGCGASLFALARRQATGHWSCPDLACRARYPANISGRHRRFVTRKCRRFSL